MVSGVTPKNEAMLFKGTTSVKFLYRISGVQYESSNRSYTISNRLSAMSSESLSFHIRFPIFNNVITGYFMYRAICYSEYSLMINYLS